MHSDVLNWAIMDLANCRIYRSDLDRLVAITPHYVKSHADRVAWVLAEYERLVETRHVKPSTSVSDNPPPEVTWKKDADRTAGDHV